jgi:hypothetical protein
MSEMLGMCLALITAASLESPSMDILDQLRWSLGRRGTL